jgi:hypothetical protein
MDLQLHAFLISARNGEKWINSRPGRFIPVERVSSTIEQESVRVSELVWTLWRREKSLVPAGNRPTIFYCPARSLFSIPTMLRRLQLRNKRRRYEGKEGGRKTCVCYYPNCRRISYYFQMTHKTLRNSDGMIFCKVVHITYMSSEHIFNDHCWTR